MKEAQKHEIIKRLIERKFPDNKEFEEQKEKLKERLKEKKREALYWQWLKELRNNSEISIGKDFM